MSDEIMEDLYILGQSPTSTIQNIGQEIQLDISLQPQVDVSPNFDKFIISTPGSYIPLRINAINGQLVNGASIDNNKFVTNLGGSNNGSVIVSIIAPIGGSYDLGIQYVTTMENTTLKVKVNDNNSITTESLATTTGLTDTDAKITTLNVYLVAGINSVEFYNTNEPCPNIGKLTFKTIPYVKNILASSATLSGAATFQSPWILDIGLQAAGQGTATFTLNTPLYGYYNMKFQYQSADYTRTFQLDINGISTQTTYTVPKTASWDTNVFGYYDVDILLNKGSNTIKFYNDNNYAPNIGNLTITQQLVDKTYEAEDSTLELPAVVKNGMVTGISYEKGSLTFTANLTTSGIYDLVINYVASTNTTETNININGVSTGETYSFEKTNSMNASDSKNEVVIVTLNSGKNTIKFYNAN